MFSLRPLPDAFILGAMRAGTTFLHGALLHHPLLVPARRKELQFFSLHWEKGARHYRRQMPLRRPRWLHAGSKRPMVIDATPYYLFHPEAPARLASMIGPEAKFIVLLREPAARAWSHYRMMLANGWEHLGLRDALAQEHSRSSRTATFPDRHPDFTQHMLFSYAARGFYAEQLRGWWRHVPRARFLLLRSEDLFAEPRRALERVCGFLGLPAMDLPDDLPRNEMPPSQMPADIRQRLDALFAAPNRELLALTGIGWARDGACSR